MTNGGGIEGEKAHVLGLELEREQKFNPFVELLENEILDPEVVEKAVDFFETAQTDLWGALRRYAVGSNYWVSQETIVGAMSAYIRRLDESHPLHQASIIRQEIDDTTSLEDSFPDKNSKLFSSEFELGGWKFAAYIPPNELPIVYFYKVDYKS